MKFEDYISAYWGRPVERRGYDRAAAEARLAHLCMMMVTLSVQARAVAAWSQEKSLWKTIVSVGLTMLRETKQAIKGIEQAYRYELKLRMLRTPEWRLKVLKDLGGIEKLLRLWNRLAFVKQHPQRKVKRQKKYLTYEEKRRRAHIQRCAKACAHPNVYRDPFRVDQEGQFRLPPMLRLSSGKKSNRPYEYDYDGRPVNNFTGLNAPIMVWPEEFFVFLDWEERPRTETVKQRRYRFVEKWLAAILEEVAEAIPKQPLIKTKTARAPPYLERLLNSHHLSPRQVVRGVGRFFFYHVITGFIPVIHSVV